MPGPVERWLETFMCKQYADTFEAFGFKTLQSVCQLQLPQLQGMGVAQEHCEKILENVHVLRQTLLAGNNKTTSLTEQSPSTHESMANSASSVLRTVAMNANLHRGPMNHYRDDLSGHYGTNSNRILGSEYLGHDNSQMIGIPPNLPGYSVQNYGDHPQNHLMMSQQAGFSGHSAMYNQHSQSQQFMGQRFSSPYSTSPYNMASSGMSSMGGGTMYNSSPTQQGPSHNTVNRYLRHNPVCHSPQQVADNILQMASNYSSPQTVHVPLAKNRVAPYHIPPQYNMQQCNIPTQPQLRHTAKFCYPSSSPHQPTARTSPISPMHMHSPASHHSNQSLPNSSPVSLHSPAPPSVKSPVTTSSPSMASLRSPCAVQPITSPVGAGQQIRSPPHVSSSTGQSSNFQMYNTGIKSPQQQQSQSHFSPNPIGSPLSRAGSPYTPASKAQIHSPSQSQNYHHTPSSISPYISDASQDSCAGPTTLVVSNPLQSLQKLILLPETQVIDPKSVVNDACLPSPSHGNDGPKNCDSSSEHRNYSSLSCSNSNSCSSNCTDGKHCDSSGMDYSFKNSLEDTKDNFGMSCNMMNVADNLNNTKSVVVQHSLYTDSSCDKKTGLIPDEIKHEIKSPVEAQLSLCTQAKDQSRDAEVPVKGASCLSSTSVEQPLAKTDQLDDTADSNKEDKESSSPPSEQETSLVNGEVDVEMESTSAEEPKEIDSVECSGGLCSPPMQKSNNADGQEVEEKSIDSDRSSLLLPKSTDNQAQVTRRTSPRKRFGLFTLPMSFEEMDKKQTVQNSGTQTNVSKLKRSKRIQNNQVVQTKQRLHNEESDSDTSCGRLRVRKDSCSTYSRQSRNPLLRSQSKVYTGGGDDADAVYDETEHCTIELHERLGSSKCLSPEEVQDSPQTEKESTENPITDKKQKSPTTENCSIRSEEENSSVSVSSLPSKQKRRTSNRILHPNKKYTQDISQESPSRTKSFSNNEEEKKNPERTKSLSNLTDHGNGTSITSGKAVNLPKNRKGQFEVITISNSSVEDESDDTKIKVAASSELDDNARKRTRKRKLTPSNTSINTSDPGVEENTSSSKEKKASKVLEIKMPNKRKQDIDIVEIDLTEDVRSEDNCNNSDGTDDEPLSKMQDFAESSPPPSDMPMEEFTPPELRAIEEEVTSDSMNKKSPKSPVTNKRKKKGRSVGKARLKGSRLNRIRSDVYDFHSDNDSLKTLKLKKTLDLMANNKRKKTEVAVTSGPFVRVTTAKDEPALCIIFNQHQEDLDLKQKKKKTLSSSSSVQISNLPSEKSVLIPRSTLLGDTWVCALCGKGSTYKFLGDLFGPYYPEGSLPILKTEKLEDFSKQDSKQKKKRTLFPADQSKNADKPQTQTRKPSEEEKGTSDLDKKMLDSSSDVSEVWVHEDCVVWSDGVYLIGTKLYGLEEAAKVALATTCSICKERGAMVGCLHKGCIQKYHYICAAEKGCYLDEENFSLLCPKHKDKKVKVVESPSTAKS